MALAIGKGGELNVVLRVKDDGSVTVEKFARNAEQGLGKGANAAKAMSAAYQHATGNITALTRNIFSLKGALAGLGVGATAKQFIDAASTAEQYRVRLNVLLGSVSEGNRLFAEMTKLASAVPFEYQEIMGSATALSGVLKGGVDEITRWMPLIADLAAASGLGIQETTGQVSRMLAAGANSADLFRERGILAMLGFQAGVQVSAEETKERLMAAWTDTNSRFRGATDQLARTWDGTMSMLSDKWFLFRNQIMDAGLFDFIKAGARVIDQDLGGALENNEEAAKRWADTIINAIETMAIGTAKFVDVVDAPLGRIAGIGSDLWAEYQRLPAWAQEAGIIGALLGGKKGLLIIGALTSVGDEWRTTAQWWQSYSSDQVGFFEWLMADNEEAAEKLEYMRRQAEMKTGLIIKNTPNLPDVMLGEGAAAGSEGSAADRVRNFFERVRAEMEAARAQAAAAAVNDSGATSSTASLIVGDTEKELQKLRAALAEKLYALDESFLSERELLANDYMEKLLLLEESLDLEAHSYEIYYERRARLDEYYSARVKKLEEKQKKESQTLWASGWQGKLSVMQGVMTTMEGLMMSNSKKMFEIGKAAAIANAIIDTYKAATGAYAALASIPYVGPALGAAAAAAAIAAGMARVQAIRSQNMGGGSGAVSPGGAVGTYPANPNTGLPATDTTARTDESKQTTPRVINIVIDSDRMLTTNFVRDQLIPEINNAVGDGVVLRVSA